MNRYAPPLAEVRPPDAEPVPRRPGLWVAAHAVLALSLVVGLYATVPRIEAVMLDFGVPIPPAARVAISGSHLVIQYVWLVPLLLAAETTAVAWGVARLLKNSRGKTLRLGVVALALWPLALIAATALGVAASLLTLHGRLTG